MSTGKTYSTKYLLDNNNNRGSEGQVLISTSEGVNWSDGSDIIGGPYLPLAGGTLTGSLAGTDSTFSGLITGQDSNSVQLDLMRGSSGTDGNTSIKFTQPLGNGYIGVDANGAFSYNIAADLYSSRFKVDRSGNGTFTGSMNLGNGASTGEKYLQIGNGSTDNGYRYIDLIGDTTYTDYGFRIIRGNGGANTTSQIVHRGTGDFSIQTTEAANLKFVTSNAERMRITSGGNVGIGTTSPSAKLQIDKANANSSVIISRSGTNIGASTSVGSITFPSHYNSSYTDYASIQAYSNNLSAVRGSLDFKVKSTSGALLTGMTVYGTSSGVNVGIGTTSPSEKLVVDGKIRSLGDTSSADFYSTGNDALIVNNGTQNLKFWNNGSERMRIKGDGNVGIGTTSPSTRLHVYESTALDHITIDGNAGDNRNLRFATEDSTRWNIYATGATESGSNVGSDLSFSRYSDTGSFLSAAMVIKRSTGNVGIGTTSPIAKLHVLGTSANNATTKAEMLSNSVFSVRPHSTNSGTLAVAQVDDGNSVGLQFTNSAGSANWDISLQPFGGNVGIGTTSPDWKLHLNSSAELTPTYQKFTNGTATTGTTLGIDSDGDFIINNGEAKEIKLYTSDSQRVTIQSGGNVGIGNTGPVNGKLVVTSGVDGPLNTIRIQHTRDDSDVGTRALEIDMNLSGADTTTGDRTNRGIYVDLDSSADGDASHEHRIHGIESDVRFTGFSDIVRAGQFYAESGNITEKTAQLVGVYGQAIHDANSTNGGVSNMMGVYGYSQPQDLGDVDNAFGGYFLVNIGTNRGNADIGVTKGVEGEISIDKSSTINYGTMIGMSSVIDNNEGAVPNFGNQYLFKGDYQGTKGSNAWGIYTEGDKHYFDGNVGIGTTSPDAKLDIGVNNIITLDDTGSSTGFIGLGSYNDGTKNRAQGASYYGFGLEIDRPNALISFNSYDSNGATGDGENTLVLKRDGNVGIGTTSPLTKLQIDNQGQGEFSGANSSSAGKSHIILKDEGSTSRTLMSGPSIVFQTPANADGTNVWASSRLLGSPAAAGSARGTFSIQVRDNYDPFNDGTSWNWRTALTAINSGNVGIGTNSPSQKLHVAGRLLVNNGSLGAAAGSTIYHAEIAGARHRLDFKEVRTAAVTSTDWKNTTYKLQMRVDSTNHQSIDFVSDASYNEHIDIYTGNQVFNTRFNANGNVGIGTTSPSRRLEVSTSVYEVSKFAGNTNDGTGYVGAVVEIETNNDARGRGVYLTHREDTDTADSEWYAGVPYTGEGYSIGNAAYGTSINSATGPAHKNQSKIFIKENGDVGIGTTTPGDKLHVNGTVRSQAPATSDWGFIGFNSAGTASSGLWFDGGSADILLRRSDNSLQGRLRSGGSSYLNGGNFGLGTTSPAQKLTVNSGRVLISNTTTPIYIKAGSNYKSWVHHIGGNDGYIFAPSTADNGETWDWANQTKLGANGVVTAKNFQLSSDKRFKNNIEDIKDIKVEAAFKSFEMESSPGEKRYGVVAQELEKTNPELVETDHEGFKSVKYIDLLIAKIAELEARLEKLEK